MQRADAQAWDAVKYFQYNIENVTVAPDVVAPGGYKVRVIFSVTDPINGGAAWNIKTAGGPFQPLAPATASLTLDIGWDSSSDFANTGSDNPALNAVLSTPPGQASAMVVQVRNLHTTGSRPCSGTRRLPGHRRLHQPLLGREGRDAGAVRQGGGDPRTRCDRGAPGVQRPCDLRQRHRTPSFR